MSYVDAFYDRKKDLIRTVERVDGERVLVDHRPEYNFFYEDSDGPHKSMYGHSVSEVVCRNYKDFVKNKELYKRKKLFESDIKPLSKTISKHYMGVDAPKLHTAFIDIESDFCKDRGYSSPDEAFLPITAIGVYLQWCETMVCLAVPPKTLSWEEALEISSKYPEVKLCRNEAQMLNLFLDLIDDADIISGWNSEGYDIPYIHNRIVRVLGKQETRRLCLWNQFPRKKTFERYGKEQTTYELSGRIHLDYLQLYKQYNYEERHSYKLDVIGELEVGERKVEYEGSLDSLYNNDFALFLEYNIQDVLLLDKIDQKEKIQFIQLHNEIAHDNTVLLPTAMGAVATSEQAIINEAHSRGMVVSDRIDRGSEDTRAPGAYVADPKKGFWKWLGSIDFTSLYPSVFRSLNMSPETIIGQLRHTYTDQEVSDAMRLHGKSYPEAWQGKFGCNEYEYVMEKDTMHPIYVDLETGDSFEATGAEIYEMIFESGQPWCISANGTIINCEELGVVPGLLARWFSERKELQAKKAQATTSAEKTRWDKRQHVKKINLNSLYGAILNAGCRFYDKRIGMSTTLTGRRLTRHMAAQTNLLFTGDYDHTGETIVYGDTDSVYFSASKIVDDLNLESATALYDSISDKVNESLPGFAKAAFNCPEKQGEIIRCNREVVGSAGIFITKKRYAIKVLDNEGEIIEGGKMKVMGMDIKRSDTPKYMQDFLVDVLENTLDGWTEDEVMAKVQKFRDEFRKMEPWRKGMPKSVNNLTHYGELVASGQANRVPGHVTASLNYNKLREMNADNVSMKITDGSKTLFCRLKSNPLGFKTVAMPVDEPHLPEWFKDLPFDNEAMEKSVLDAKLQNVLGIMGWDFSKSNQSYARQKYFS